MLSIGLQSVRSIAFIYADPGSGALLWQLVGSFFIGLVFYVRRFTRWVKPASSQTTNETAGDGD